MAVRRIRTIEELDATTPQERADAFDESIVDSWDDVDPEFRAMIEATVASHSAGTPDRS